MVDCLSTTDILCHVLHQYASHQAGYGKYGSPLHVRCWKISTFTNAAYCVTQISIFGKNDAPVCQCVAMLTNTGHFLSDDVIVMWPSSFPAKKNRLYGVVTLMQLFAKIIMRVKTNAAYKIRKIIPLCPNIHDKRGHCVAVVCLPLDAHQILLWCDCSAQAWRVFSGPCRLTENWIK